MKTKFVFQLTWLATLVALTALSAHAQEALVSFGESFDMEQVKMDHSEVTKENVDGKDVLVITAEKAKYPGLTLENRRNPWNAADAVGLAFDLTNTSSRSFGVHARLDNPGPWGKVASNSNQLWLGKGKTKQLKVYFDKNYGHPAKRTIDGSKISKMLLFIPNAKGGETLQVNAIYPITSSASSSSSTASSSSTGDAFRPGIEGVLCDFDKTFNEDLLKTEGTDYSLVAGKDGKALKLEIPAKRSYPGIRFNAPKGAWNLADFGGVKVDVTNNGNKKLRACLRVDNKGNYKKEPWNTSYTNIKPGQTKELIVTFGKNNGGPGFPLNSERVIGILFFTMKQKVATSITLDNLRGFGSPAPKTALVIPITGEMEKFEQGFDISSRTKSQGCNAKHEKGQIQIEFDGSTKWPAFSIMPAGKAWNLENFESVQLEMTNTGTAKASFGVRVDNPGADGRKNCNAENVTLNPKQTKTIKVTFGKSWGNKAFDLDAKNVVNIMIIGPSKKASVTIDNLKANRKQWAELPAWLGQKPPVKGNWVQTLNEDFTESALNKNVWDTRMCYDGPLKGELQVYSEKNLTVEDGNLVFLCEKKKGHQYDDPKLPTREYTTAIIQSYDKFSQKYGYFESRFKAPTARGLWPAFWLMPDRGEKGGNKWERRATKGKGMEIDIYEYLCEWGPGRYNVAAHWDGYGDDHKSWGTSQLHHLPTEDGYHTFGLLWEPGRFVFYCDGKQMAEYKNARIASVPMYMILNVQTGRWATKNIDDSALPDKWLVDYVRVWQSKERIK